MNIALLGKTMKAMYKLSGKTLNNLSEETGLTVDTINNVFYARLQKPSYFGIKSLVEACGYKMTDLTSFMEYAETLPKDADFIKEFSNYIISVENTNTLVEITNNCSVDNENTTQHECCNQIKELNEAHENQLNRFRATHLHYAEQLEKQYKEQIEQMAENIKTLKFNYDNSIIELRNAHKEELDRVEKSKTSLKRMNFFLTAALIVVAIGAVLIALIIKG